MGVKEILPLMKSKRIFDLMFPLTPKFLASTPSLSHTFFVPPPYANACTCIFLLGIWTPKKTLCLISYSQFSSVSVTSSTLINISKKIANVDGTFPFFLQHLFLVCPMFEQKKHFKP